MKYETIKSILLVFLVLLSVGLTWANWSYQPQYEALSKNKVSDTPIRSAHDEFNDVIKPNKIVYRDREQVYYGSSNESEVNRVMQSMTNWNLSNFGSRQTDKNKINHIIQGQNRMVMVFPNVVPYSVFNEMLSAKKNNLPNDSFDTLVITFDETVNGQARLYFINTQTDSFYIATVKQSVSRSLKQSIEDQQENSNSTYQRYAFVDNIFVPESKISMTRYTYYISGEISKYKSSLFPDSKSLKCGTVYGSSTNTDCNNAISQLKYDTALNMLYFVTPNQESSKLIPSAQLLKNSIDFIDAHGNFNANTYHMFQYDTRSNGITFRMFKNGIPVFNDNDTSQIYIEWGDTGVFKYTRPYFKIESSIPNEAMDDNELPIATDVLTRLKEENIVHIQDLMLGYAMSDANGGGIITFEPKWYYKYNGEWKQADSVVGGEARGME